MSAHRTPSPSSLKPRRRAPASGRAMTQAQRARRYRARRKRAGIAILQFDPRVVRAGRPLSNEEQHQYRDALRKIRHYQREIERLTARNARLRTALSREQKRTQ